MTRTEAHAIIRRHTWTRSDALDRLSDNDLIYWGIKIAWGIAAAQSWRKAQ